jgi:hypothetical protein
MAARQWTAEQQQRQAELIHTWKPWERSTGARTTAGKAVSSKNVLVGKANRQKALEQARVELAAVQAKIRKLTARR